MQFDKGLLNNRQEADQIYLYDSDSFEKSMAPELNGSYSEHSSNQNELRITSNDEIHCSNSGIEFDEDASL